MKGYVMHSLSARSLAVSCATILALCPCASNAETTEARFRAIYTTEWKWRDKQFPDNEDAQRPIQDHLPKTDPQTQAMRLRTWQDVLRRLDALPTAELSPAEQLNYAVYRPQIETLIASQKF